MRIEVFNRSKFRDGSDPGDDVPLVVPGLVYGVFDGATDPRGTRVDGIAAGRLAALAAASAMAALAQEAKVSGMPGREIIEHLASALRRASDGLDLFIPPSTTAAIALDCGEDWRLLLLGDSGLRINATEAFRSEKLIDTVATIARVAVFKLLSSRFGLGDEVEMSARATILLGFDQAVERGLLSVAEANEIIEATARAAGLAPQIELVDRFLSGGIQIQHQFGNSRGNPLCFETLNGTDSALTELLDFTRPKSEVSSIELYSDGYAALPDAPTAAAWEAAFARAEAEDFHRIGPFATVKGSTEAEFFDDRTVVIVATSSNI
ncbi:hypothetical protein [Tropicimonas sp. IMCC6043]|uniref:hypothetical protein n=1 Tax=Tropicimonas sp. IMCC6043 TaxID=2510645 RepID=UPI00101DF209|nr:hypothetical protein [Tropicimonas sp. IMCC6043]RYH07138.1 hypothetical protein EU800_21350 [Tropicimonas sp. IMCC6043]